jgi:hypothetical protein
MSISNVKAEVTAEEDGDEGEAKEYLGHSKILRSPIIALCMDPTLIAALNVE